MQNTTLYLRYIILGWDVSASEYLTLRKKVYAVYEIMKLVNFKAFKICQQTPKVIGCIAHCKI